MRLVSFSVENYRSITRAERINVGQATVLVGPNNEGKSNLVRGLVMAAEILTTSGPYSFISSGAIVRPRVNRSGYSWSRDFPMQLREKKPEGKTVVELDFELTDLEVAEFKEKVKSALSGCLSVQVTLGPINGRVAILKQGSGGKRLNEKIPAIVAFIRDKVSIEYIPAIRTADSAEAVVNSLLERELSVLETDPAYSAALKTVADLQKPLLDQLSQSVRQTMVKFLPAIKDVRFQIPEARRFQALRRSASVIVDDGTATELQYKGDGVQSLAALALMRHASESAATDRTFVIVIEEPESHLHPSAMRSLRVVLDELRQKHQLVLTTHSPLFVDRESVGSNIIVKNTVARPAKDIAEVRDVLGVRASDNLQLAEVVLIVEGEEDKVALEAILKYKSAKLTDRFASRKLAIESLNGGSNLSYKAGLLRDALLCTCYAFLDNDATGKTAAKKAIEQGLLTSGEITFASALDLSGDSEMEDLYDPKAYRDLFFNSYGIDIERVPKFNKSKKKWSERIELAFKFSGKHWDEQVKAAVKSALANYAAQHPESILHPHRLGAVDSVVALLEQHSE
jgi:putative ATP-dependent endonuclease of OLD family